MGRLAAGMALAATLAAAGCAPPPPAPSYAEHETAVAGLIGLSEAALIARLGIPTRRSDTGTQSFLVYHDQDAQRVPRFSTGVLGTVGATHSVAAFDCDTTFVLVDHVVTAFDLSGLGCGTSR